MAWEDDAMGQVKRVLDYMTEHPTAACGEEYITDAATGSKARGRADGGMVDWQLLKKVAVLRATEFTPKEESTWQQLRESLSKDSATHQRNLALQKLLAYPSFLESVQDLAQEIIKCGGITIILLDICEKQKKILDIYQETKMFSDIYQDDPMISGGDFLEYGRQWKMTMIFSTICSGLMGQEVTGRAVGKEDVTGVKQVLFRTLLKLLLEAVDSEGRTVLLLSAADGDEEVVSKLLDMRVNPNVQDEYGWTALHNAVWRGHVAVVEQLLKGGADQSVHDKRKQLALHLGAERGQKEIVQLLLDGAHPNHPYHLEQRCVDEQTVLHRAAWGGSKEAVSLLLEKRAHQGVLDKNSKTELDVAVEKGHEPVVRLLLEKGADPNAQNKCPLGYWQSVSQRFWDGREEQMSFHVAVKKGYISVVKLLLDKGANPNVQNTVGQVAVDFAIIQYMTAITDQERMDIMLEKMPKERREAYMEKFVASVKEKRAIITALLSNKTSSALSPYHEAKISALDGYADRIFHRTAPLPQVAAEGTSS